MASNLSALELLEMGDAGREPPFTQKIWPYAMGVFVGVGAAMSINFGTSRPLLSGIQKHILGTAFCCGALHFLEEKRVEYYAERDAMLRHYVSLHPEDFPTPPKRKIGDIYEKWIPVR